MYCDKVIDVDDECVVDVGARKRLSVRDENVDDCDARSGAVVITGE